MENLYYDLDCPILDVGQRMGWSQYIDYIRFDKNINYKNLVYRYNMK